MKERVYEYTDPEGVPIRFRTKTGRRHTRIDIVLHGAFTGLRARNIQRALHLDENGEFTDVELVLRRRVSE